jgi:predicted metalloprotease with PDZ domain
MPDRISLIDASKNRWSGANTRVYARGMIVAFLCDVEMMSRSGGRGSVETLLREIYAKHGGNAKAEDGNTAVLAAMRANAELNNVITSYIEGSQKIDWTTQLAAAGIESISDGAFVKLNVVAKPNRKQKDLLNRLGYNQWRSLSNSSK